jgi:osmoprotectant transport system permease protein
MRKRLLVVLLAVVVLSTGLILWRDRVAGLMGMLREELPGLLDDLPAALGGHMLLSMAALVVGILVSLPLGIAVSRRPPLAETVLGVAGVLQTVPSLALLALMVPLLGGTIGFWPAFVAMTLYSVLPILKNTVTGLREVDERYVEAARGLGMTDRETLLRVKLPLAAPVIMAGVRLATVLVVGTATLATPVGQKTLGNYIFAGLNTRDYLGTVFGCVCAAALAVVLDQLIRLLELASDPRGRQKRLARLLIGGLGLIVVVAGGLYQPIVQRLRPPANPVVLGSADYTEQYVLGEVLRGTLHDAGFSVDQRTCMGETIEFDSLCAGTIDCYVDYTGNIWTTLMKRQEPADPRTTLREVTAYLKQKHGVVCLGPLGFQNAYALAMRRQDAERLKVKTLGDLVPHAPRMRIAGDLQFFSRPEWQRLRAIYRLAFAESVPGDPTLMYGALRDRKVDVICAYTSDGRIPAYDLVVLDDPKQAFPPYDAVLLLSPRAGTRADLRAALNPLLGSIDLVRMQQANGRVDIDRRRPRRAGAELRQLLATRPRGDS